MNAYYEFDTLKEPCLNNDILIFVAWSVYYLEQKFQNTDTNLNKLDVHGLTYLKKEFHTKANYVLSVIVAVISLQYLLKFIL